jgi:hypothetical protein
MAAPKKTGLVGRAVRRVVLGPQENRHTPGPTDAEIQQEIEKTNRGDQK